MADDEAKLPHHKLLPFECPEGFEPVTFLITALDKEGRAYSNAPVQDAPEAALILALHALMFVNRAVAARLQGLLPVAPSEKAHGALTEPQGTA